MRLGKEGAGTGVICAWEEDQVVLAGGGADCLDDFLDGLAPETHVEVVGLVHDTEDDIGVGGVLGCECGPDGDEVLVSHGTVALTNDLAVPSCIVVDINNTLGSTCGQTALNKCVIGCAIGSIKTTT